MEMQIQRNTHARSTQTHRRLRFKRKCHTDNWKTKCSFDTIEHTSSRLLSSRLYCLRVQNRTTKLTHSHRLQTEMHSSRNDESTYSSAASPLFSFISLSKITSKNYYCELSNERRVATSTQNRINSLSHRTKQNKQRS